jgi:tRNA G18 (ribose-2'-O)-methylase SpoU
MRRALTTPELCASKLTRNEFLARPRKPITVVLDGVTQNYNIGAIFRLLMKLSPMRKPEELGP